jgi:hypothetical protein
MLRQVLLGVLIVGSSRYSFATGCPSGTPVATLKLTVLPAKGGPALPLNSVNILGPGEKLRYEPVELPEDVKETARVAVIIVPAGETAAKHFKVLPPQPVKAPAEWLIPDPADAIGLIFGSYGIDTKKVTSLIQKHPEVVTKLADYAEESTRVEALVQTLSQYEKSSPEGQNLQSVLEGFSSQYGVKLPSFDNKTASSQQVLSLLKAIAPAVTAKDPLPSRSDVVVKAGGLAESVAAIYFGAPVALTAGGAALFQSLHSSLFPPTNFRSAFAQPAESAGMNLCSAKQEDKDTRAHIDYVWMSRIPNQESPNVSLIADAHLAAGVAATISVSATTVAELENLSRARDWKLISGADATPIPAKVTSGSSSDTITLDLSQVKLTPGQYQLAADWDWTPFKVNGKIQIHTLGDITNVRITGDSRDALIAGTGEARIQLTGIDFEFVDSVSLGQPGNPQKTVTLPFTLPKGKQQGNQSEMQVSINTATLAPGRYSLAIQQVNGVTTDVPITVHPPNPELTQIPLRVNMSEPQQNIMLHGKHLDRIEKIISAHADWTLAAIPDATVELTERRATIRLAPTMQKGDHLGAEIVVRDLEKPLRVDDIARVVGPRPKITGATKAFANGASVELRDGEIPAGTAVSFSLQAESIGSHPRVDLACSSESDTRRKISLVPGDKADSAELDVTGEGSLFLSVDPGVVGDSGCQLTAQLTERETGMSEPFAVGRVIRLPRITGFVLTDEKLGDSSYAATLTGRDLQLIDKTGWGSAGGETVQGIPTPVPGSPQDQTLKIVILWPPPSPKAPLYIWLRGENQARQTTARY